MGGATIQTQWSGDDHVLIELAGAIEGDYLDTLRDTLVTLLVRRRPAHVVIDLTATTRLDPIALGALDAAQDAATDLGIDLTVRHRKVRGAALVRPPAQRTRSGSAPTVGHPPRVTA